MSTFTSAQFSQLTNTVKNTAVFIYRPHWSPLCVEISTLAFETNIADEKVFQWHTASM